MSVKSRSILTILALMLLSAGAIYLALGLRLSYDFEDFFPKEDPATAYFFKFRDQFETDNDFFFVAIENDKSVFDLDFLKKIDSLNNDLKSLKNVQEAIGPTQLYSVAFDPFFGGMFQTPMLSIDSAAYLKSDSATIWNTPGMVGVFFSEDGKSVAVNMKHTQKLSKLECDELSDEIEAVVAKYKFHKTHVIGRALGQKLYVELMVRELALFISLSLVLTILFLFIAFRSGWGIIIPTLVVLLAIIWTLGFIRIMGKDVDLMLTILPTILFVVGMSDSVHVLTKYLQEIRAGRDKIAAIKYAFKSIRLATFLTALTTSIGFFTLYFSNIQPISDFGVYTAVGVLLAYGLTFTLLPAILILGQPKRMVAFAVSEDFWTLKLHRFFSWILRYRFRIMVTGGILIAVGAYYTSLIVVDNKMLEDLKDDHILKQEFNFMEKHFAGCRPFEMGIQLPNDSAIAKPEVMHQLDTLSQYLIQKYGVGYVFSYSNLIRETNKIFNYGEASSYVVPNDKEALAETQRLLANSEMKEITRLTYNDSTNMLRIAGKVGDVGRVHFEQENEKLHAFMQQHCPDLMNYELTGTAHLIDVNNKSLVENTVWDLLISVLVIGIIMGIVYKSWRMVPLTIIPNLFPLLLVAGIMGLTGIPLKVSTSIIFNIAFGIAVDDTIHFLARVKSFLNEGLSVQYAVKRTFLTTGKAMIVTTLILSAGFTTLIFSQFLGTYYIGLLVSLTLFIALFAELIYSPLIILYFFRNKGVKQGLNNRNV